MAARTADSRIQTICLVILCAVAMAAAAHWLRPVLVPFVLALFLTIGLTPLIDLQVRDLQIAGGLLLSVGQFTTFNQHISVGLDLANL